MSITTIADPSIKLVVSPKLRDFIKTLDSNLSMPENIQTIYNSNRKDCPEIEKYVDDIENIKYTEDEEQFLKSIEASKKIDKAFTNLLNGEKENEDSDDKSNDEKNKSKEIVKKKKDNKKYFIYLKDVKWLNKTLKEMRENDDSSIYLHELIQECQLILPENEQIERNPELEARCQKLKRQQEEVMYHNMTKNVDNFRKNMPEDTISYQLKQINRQLIAVAQFIFSVAAGFAFGFLGIELIVGNLDFGFRLLLGIIIALVIALAEIYFLAKKLNEEADELEDVKKQVNTGQRNMTKPELKPHQE